MQVDFNNLRKHIAFTYDSLAKKLNAAIEYRQLREEVVDDIQEDMDDLRNLVVSLCCVYLKDDESFRSVIDEVQPLASFNEED
jgi:hypothetical protein